MLSVTRWKDFRLYSPVVAGYVVGSTERKQGRERNKDMFSHFSLAAIKLQTVY